MNLDPRTVDGFGEEWTAFDQRALPESELRELFHQYFDIFPEEALHEGAVGFDLGCGSGRWARFVAPRVRRLHCIDASDKALQVARRNLSQFENCEFHHASVDSIPLEPSSMDFGYCLGVLHHVPDTQAGIMACAALLRPRAPFLLYLYYNFENRTAAFKLLWRLSNVLRNLIASSPFRIRQWITSLIAISVYLPLARLSRTLARRGRDIRGIPLSYYRDRSFYTMRTDALDRFGTRLEKRFSRGEITALMEAAGFDRITFSTTPPFWCALGHRAEPRPR